MNYDEIRAKYFEIIYDERDLIQDFLEKQKDIRYGTQIDEWTLSPTPELKLFSGGTAKIHYIKLDENDFVLFFGLDGKAYRCYDFYYGELEGIIKQLPDPDELNRKNAIVDLNLLTEQCDLTFEDDETFSWKDNDSVFEIHNIARNKDGKLEFEIHETISNKDGGWGLWEELPENVVTKFAEHAKIVVLHRSEEYKKLVKLLSESEGDYFNFSENNEHGWPSFNIKMTDLRLVVQEVGFHDGKISIYGDCWVNDKSLQDYTFEEKDIDAKYLEEIIEIIEKSRKPDVNELAKLTEEQSKLIDEYEAILAKMHSLDILVCTDCDDSRMYYVNGNSFGMMGNRVDTKENPVEIDTMNLRTCERISDIWFNSHLFAELK